MRSVYDKCIVIGILTISVFILLIWPCLETLSTRDRVLHVEPSSSCESTEAIPPVAVLFTMYNTDNRAEQTDRVIDYYANKVPKQCTFLVDSANRGVSIDRVPSSQQAVFEQGTICPITYVRVGAFSVSAGSLDNKVVPGPTLAEICSLEYALDHLEFGNAKHVIKLTAKYCIPSFCRDVLHNIEEDADIIVQRARHVSFGFGYKTLPDPDPDQIWSSRVNTEILGFKLQKAKDIIREIKSNTGILEARVQELISSGKYKIQILPVLHLSTEHRLIPRSDGSILSSL